MAQVIEMVAGRVVFADGSTWTDPVVAPLADVAATLNALANDRTNDSLPWVRLEMVASGRPAETVAERRPWLPGTFLRG